MLAVRMVEPGRVVVDELPYPVMQSDRDAIVRVETTAICGTDLHLYHGRLEIESDRAVGHEFVGEVVETGDAVRKVAVGDRVLGCFQSACGACFHCLRSEFHKCDTAAFFGLGSGSGGIDGAQCEAVRVPHADLCLRPVPAGMADDIALLAGDVMSTGYHAVQAGGVRPGDSVAIMGLGAVGLCALQCAIACGAATVFAIDSIYDRLAVAQAFGGVPLSLADDDVRARIKQETGGRGVDVAIDAVGDPRVLDMAIRITRSCGAVSLIGVHSERCEVHMGLAWYKALRIFGGQANPIRDVDAVLRMLAAGRLQPTGIVTHHMDLADAPEAYAMFDRREALKIILRPGGVEAA